MSGGTVVTAVGFWLGAMLPILYVPVIATGIDSPTSLATFLCLLGVHVTALVVGHDHRRET